MSCNDMQQYLLTKYFQTSIHLFKFHTFTFGKIKYQEYESQVSKEMNKPVLMFY